MHRTRKGNHWCFGMKPHIGVDESCKASMHAKVEHPFRVIKRQFGYSKMRYRGLVKNIA